MAWQRLGIPIEVVPGLCTCAAAIKREGLVQREGRLWLQKSGLPLQTTEEVRLCRGALRCCVLRTRKQCACCFAHVPATSDPAVCCADLSVCCTLLSWTSPHTAEAIEPKRHVYRGAHQCR